MTDVTKEMIDRFLSWRLPYDFAPDGGVSFEPLTHPEWPKGFGWPVGTNLLTHEQAKQMLVHVLGGTPELVLEHDGSGWSRQANQLNVSLERGDKVYIVRVGVAL